ncbi:MAG: hypothetical protein ACREEA_12280, partial [Stellaceae bacterium]
MATVPKAKPLTSLESDPAADLAAFLPESLWPLANPQTDLPRIARDSQAMTLIHEAVRCIPTRHHLFRGDARKMKRLAPSSVHLVLTSPPYWTLKEYRPHQAQLG